MSNKLRITQVVLLVVGMATWAVVAGILRKGGNLEYRPNVLHLKGSPYGRTLALAMRGPADVYWHRGEVHDDEPGGCDHEDCDHDHGDCDHGDCEDGACGHADADAPPTTMADMVTQLAEEAAEHEESEHGEEEEAGGGPEITGLRPYLLDTIDAMRQAYHSRNNQRGEGKLHKAFVMAETERRLALSYQMDPTNTSCYGTYFLFLAEAIARIENEEGEESVIRQRRNSAFELSHYTILYCLNYQDEAPAMITASIAAHDYLQFHFSAPDPDLEQIAEGLEILDKCLDRYEAIRARMIEEGTWENFFASRRDEMEKSHSLARALRNADHTVFKRLSGNSVAAPAPPAEEGMPTR